MADLTDLAARVWFGSALAPRAARAALAPLALAYRGVVAARGALYDIGLLEAQELALPSVSVGNLTVGGTGKTPVAAWVAGEMRRQGERPAVVLRGYGGDEPLVHEHLTPGVIVVADPDRVRGVAHARGLGATAVVLDDAFQHRRARRGADIVLVSVDQWTGDARMLPAGPFREPLHALRRATVVVLTRKAASEQQAEALGAELRGHAPALRTAVACLAPAELRRWGGPETAGPEAIAGQTVLAVSAIGDPAAFEAQLAGLGAQVVSRRFRDHHAFTAADATALARDAETTSARLVCTLKDAVKLGPVWPRAHHPLWYVSQRVTVERGAHELGRAIRAALRAQRS